jgi:hypothetical protein
VKTPAGPAYTIKTSLKLDSYGHYIRIGTAAITLQESDLRQKNRTFLPE